VRTITIICHDSGVFDVHVGENFANHLTFDEMLGEAVRLTTNIKPRYMETPDQLLARLESYKDK